MDRRYDRYVRAEIAAFPDRDLRVVLAGEIEIDEGPPADFGVDAVVERNGPLQKNAFVHFAEDLFQDGAALFGPVFIQPVVIEIQVVRFQFSLFPPRLRRAEKKAVVVIEHKDPPRNAVSRKYRNTFFFPR